MENQNSSHTVWYIVGVVVIALALWYFFSQTPSPAITTETPITEQTQQTQQTQLSSGDTTVDISADLTQTADDSASLDAAASAAASDISSL